MAAISSIRTSGDRVEIIDQLLLPHTQEWIEIDTIEKAYETIKSMRVRDIHISIRADLSRSFRRAHLDSGGTGHWFTGCSVSGVARLCFPRPGPTPGFPGFPSRV